MKNLPSFQLHAQLEGAIASGHPWVYRDHLPRHDLNGGEWVVVRAGRAQAYGVYDAHSPIALRLFGPEAPSDAAIATRVQQALQWRENLFDPRQTNAYRLLNGEGDFLPGITADRYERYAVLQTYAESLAGLLPVVVKTLAKHATGLRGIVQRESKLQRENGEMRVLWGEAPPPELTILENGLRLIANLYDGQKTGLFLDHRDNRALVERFARGKRVLNLFAYTGAFSLYAARGGASETHSVDIASGAMRDAARNFALNGFEPTQHQFVTADCFELLERCAAEKQRFDLVILDPPSLARSKDNRHAAARAYKKLNALALRVLAPGGLLATASCTSQISSEHFKEIVQSAGQDNQQRLQIVQENGQAPDHPVPSAFPEGRYLKFLLCRILP